MAVKRLAQEHTLLVTYRTQTLDRHIDRLQEASEWPKDLMSVNIVPSQHQELSEKVVTFHQPPGTGLSPVAVHFHHLPMIEPKVEDIMRIDIRFTYEPSGDQVNRSFYDHRTAISSAHHAEFLVVLQRMLDRRRHTHTAQMRRSLQDMRHRGPEYHRLASLLELSDLYDDLQALGVRQNLELFHRGIELHKVVVDDDSSFYWFNAAFLRVLRGVNLTEDVYLLAGTRTDHGSIMVDLSTPPGGQTRRRLEDAMQRLVEESAISEGP